MKTPLFLLSVLSGVICCASYYSSSSSSSCSWIRSICPRHSITEHSQTPIAENTHGWWNWGVSKPSANRMMMRASRNGDDTTNAKGQKHKSLAPKYSPKTVNQRAYCDYLSDSSASIVLGIGPAGTGKTLFACITAINMLRRGEIQKIVLTRPVVAVEEELGFLPGNMVMKMDPWTRPIFDIFLEFYSQKDVDAMVQSGTIEISPLAYMRGRTFKRAFIIADEMQNSSPNQMLMLITRIGEGSKMVITGDLKQSDRFADNGLRDFMQKLHCKHCIETAVAGDSRPGAVYSLGGIRAIELSSDDIERSEIVKQVLTLYESPRRDEPAWSLPKIRTELSNSTLSGSTLTASHNNDVGLYNDDESITASDAEQIEFYMNTTTEKPPVSPNTIGNTFEIVSNDDAALIPKNHTSKHYQGENFNHYSSGKWSGW